MVLIVLGGTIVVYLSIYAVVGLVGTQPPTHSFPVTLESGVRFSMPLSAAGAVVTASVAAMAAAWWILWRKPTRRCFAAGSK